MTDIRNILAATDFSEYAHAASLRAAQLAAAHGARLRLLHVLEADALQDLKARLRLAEPIAQGLEAAVQGQLEALARELTPLAGSPAECALRSGKLLDEVLAAADHADVLVLGVLGSHLARDVLFGTTAERLLRRSRRPMLVVRAASQAEYRHVFVPVDFSVHSLNALRFAHAIAPQALFHVFHAYENPYEGKLEQAGVRTEVIETFQRESRDEALANVANLIEKGLPSGVRVTSSVAHGRVRPTLLEAAQRHGADLIVMGKQGRSMVGEYFLGGATRSTVALAKCDVAVVPDFPRL